MKTTLFVLTLFLSIFSYAQNKQWNCIDTNGTILFSIEAKSVSDFSDGLAKVYQQNYVAGAWQKVYGFVDTTGKFVIPCKYASAKDFKDGLSWVQTEKGGKYILIDKQDHVIPTKGYLKVGHIIEGSSDLLAVFENKKFGFINRKGEEVIACKYLGSKHFTEGLACLALYDSKVEEYGFFRKDGSQLTPFQYKQSGHTSFHNGLCRVNWKGKTSMIDTTGALVFTTKYNSLQNFNFGLAAVCTNSDRTGWGFINNKDELIIPTKYDNVSPFNEDGLAQVKDDGLKGVIDTTGKIVIPIIYETVYYSPSKDGFLCGVYKSDEPLPMMKKKLDYFDENFQKITFSGKIMSSANYSPTIKLIDESGLNGYINRNYEIIVSPQFKKATLFHENKAWTSLD